MKNSKPKIQIKTGFFYYHKCAEYINKKYECNIEDYAGEFCEKAKHSKAVSTLGDKKEYWDFWHFIIKYTGASNGSYFTLDEYSLDNAEEWQKEILRLFFLEFGKDIEFYVEW